MIILTFLPKIKLHMKLSNFAILLLLLTTFVTGCNKNDNKPTQSLARVNDQDITIYQLNDELIHADLKSSQQELISSQMLEVLIDRQLLKDEAIRTKLNRTPEVLQAIERAKAKILADAYLASISKKISEASTHDVKHYFDIHPEYFLQRKQFVLHQLMLTDVNNSNEYNDVFLKLDDINKISAWLDNHKITYSQRKLLRKTTDLPEDIATNFTKIKKGHVFIIQEDSNLFVNAISKIRDDPVNFQVAAPQILQYLSQQLIKETVASEQTRLRALSNIRYLNPSSSASTQPLLPVNKNDASTHQ